MRIFSEVLSMIRSPLLLLNVRDGLVVLAFS